MEVLAPASVVPSEVHTGPHSKKPRLVFTDLQRRTLQAIFKVRFPAFFGGGNFFWRIFCFCKSVHKNCFSFVIIFCFLLFLRLIFYQFVSKPFEFPEIKVIYMNMNHVFIEGIQILIYKRKMEKKRWSTFL